MDTIPDDEAVELLGEGIHTGLRRGSDAIDAGRLWRAIADSETSAWGDAILYAVQGLREMGYAIVKVKTGG